MNFIGKYGADRATITIEPSGTSDAEIIVEWPSSAAEGSTWYMSGTFDTNTLTVNYTNCVKVDYAYEGEGEDDRTETVAYTDGSGSITFDGGSNLTWNDQQEHIADGVTFSWAS